MQDRQCDELIQDGITAVKSGNRPLAIKLLNKASLINSADARIWIWLSATTDDPQEQRSYLERAVAADPSNAAARRGLVMLSEKLDKSRLMPEGAAYVPQVQPAPEEANGKAYLCPQCGGAMSYDIHKTDLVCQSCGYVQVVEEHLAPDSAEQVMDFVMPTTRAHRWAESQARVACEQCGAVTLLPPGQTADRCPYCGSNRFVDSPTLSELVDPQVIGLMKVDPQEADRRVKAWFGKGLLAPDDLVARHGGLQLRPAYYPFWTFDGTLELPWSCEINVGTSKAPQWEMRNGSQFDMFDDVLVPGLRSMSPDDLAGIEPFSLKDLVDFSPDFLPGWVSLTYDYSLADASLRAREKVLTRLRHSLYSLVEPTHSKRNFNILAGKWSGLTFKHVLLPLYVGNYTYRGKPYRLLVNGQTGKVSGKKPQDILKAVMLTAGALILLAILISVIYALWRQFAG
jgi:DNA-directed RNA polymerase subunit RPC12/RpoP